MVHDSGLDCSLAVLFDQLDDRTNTQLAGAQYVRGEQTFLEVFLQSSHTHSVRQSRLIVGIARPPVNLQHMYVYTPDR